MWLPNYIGKAHNNVLYLNAVHNRNTEKVYDILYILVYIRDVYRL